MVNSAGNYDVFLSHSSNDKEFVEWLSVELERQEHVKVFLDKWHLIPGEPLQEALEQALENSKACAVFVGPGGIGPWQNEELRTALDARTRDKALRVIPVLLPGVRGTFNEAVSPFLRRFLGVDYRGGVGDVEAFQLLVAGIRGRMPGCGGGEFDPGVRPGDNVQSLLGEYPKLAACLGKPQQFLRECLSLIFTDVMDVTCFCSVALNAVRKNIMPTDSFDVIIQIRMIEYCVSRGQVDNIWEGLKIERKEQYDKFYPIWCDVVKKPNFEG